MASSDSFECIKNISLKLDFNNCKIIDLIQILIKNPIRITERRALVHIPKAQSDTDDLIVFLRFWDLQSSAKNCF